MITVKRVNLKDLIRSSEDKIFSVVFIKKNGEERKMLARLGVKKGVKGTGHSYKNPLAQPYINVFDMQKMHGEK